MEAFGVAASILQVAGAGIKLTRELYNFGTNAYAAAEHTDFVAKNISLYCRVLRVLGQQLPVDNPDHTQEALEVAQELQEQSYSLAGKIKKLLPSPCMGKHIFLSNRDCCGTSGNLVSIIW